MKKIISSFVIMFFALHSSAQLQLIDPVTNTVALASYQFVLPEIDNDFKIDFNVKNNSNEAKKIRVVKTVINQATGHESNFCFVTNCYTTSSLVSKPENIKANGIIPEVVMEGLFGLQADFNAIGKKGNSIIRYRIENILDAADTTSVELRYTVDNLLPIQWISFKVSEINKKALLQWTVQQEKTDVLKFIVQRSTDGRIYTDIDEVNVPLKNDNSIYTYQYTDASSFDGKILYRIKSMDQDNQVRYSTIQTFLASSFKQQLFQLKTTNPILSGSPLKIELSAVCSGTTNIVITDMSGHIMQTEQVVLDGASISKNLTYNLSQSMSGLYLLTVINNGNQQTIRLIVK